MTATFVKRSRGAKSDAFAVEAAGLRWLAAAGPGAARVVEAIEVADDRIVLAMLSPGRPTATAAEAFGRALAKTHAAGAAAFGQPPDGWEGNGYIGVQPMAMRPTASWGQYFAEQRMMPFARAAYDLGNLSDRGLALVERVAERVHDGDFDDGRPPERIHGDLWSGNVIFTDSGVVLIDPAAHGGRGLTDLAMLHLFGAPHLTTIAGAYAEAAALGSGWRDLIGLHQLHPLLVHAVTHGPSYAAEAEQVAARYL